MAEAPAEVADQTQMRPSPFPVEDSEVSNPEPEGAWEAPPGRLSREQPAVRRYSTGTDYPASTPSGPVRAVEAEEPIPLPWPGHEEGYPSEDFPDERSEASNPRTEAASDAQPSGPGGTLDPEGEDSDPYGAGPSVPDGPRVGGPSETRIAPLDEIEEPAAEDEGDGDATRAGPPIKLKIVAGPDAGKTKKFNGVRLVIGRAPDCDLKLLDQSVSRRHLELVQGKEGVLLRDLGSGNGTKVNGVKTAEKLLVHDDEIAIGKTKFRYVDEVAAFKKLRDDAERQEQEAIKAAEEEKAEAEAPPPPEVEVDEPKVVVDADVGVASPEEIDQDDPSLRAVTNAGVAAIKLPVRPSRTPRGGGQNPWQKLEPKRRLQIIAGGAGALVLIIIVIALATRKPPPPPPDPRQAPAEAQMQLARTAIRAENYEEAEKYLTEAEKLLPGIDSDHLLERVTKEAAARRVSEVVRTLIAEERFDDARTQLATLEAVTAKAEEEKKKLEAELVEQEAVYQARSAEELLDANDLEAARQIIIQLPPDKQGPLLARADELEEERKAEQKVEAARSAQRSVAAKKARDAAREAAIQQAFAAVARKFHGGEYQRAAAECDRVVDDHPGESDLRARAKLLQTLIPNFGRNFEDGHRKFKAGQLGSSVKPLRRARELYRQIGFEGALGQQIDEELAAAALAAGKEALAHGDLGGAALNFRDAARLDPSDSRARDGLEQVSARAEDLFTEAYMVRDRDPREAVAKFRLVLELTSPSSNTHQRAKSQLAALQPDKR